VSSEDYRVDQKDMGRDLQKVLVTDDQISARLAEMAAQIDADYVFERSEAQSACPE
jgi:hypoxanthine phosphoribosyltransferase